ncbi:hypothetical protein TNCT_592841 [Trichonephila clavata]|uniref:Uncharacterized protein n=1 Tax=Trichonephila clavata TaxID=2740835 RepID=A0A8X6I2G0_TRICU|nr:hypothetical protein TNCT_592841 [Trichonephila clavata]
MDLSWNEPVLGFLAFQYNNNPILGMDKIIIANLTESLTIICDQNWYRELNQHVERLKITELYVLNCFHCKFVQQFVPEGVMCRNYKGGRIERCNICNKFSCPSVKIAEAIGRICNINLDVRCDVNK